MPTVFEVIVQAARALEAMQDGTATGGAANQIIDTNLPLIGWDSDDDFAGGWAAILRDAGGAGAAPQGQTRNISAYTGAGGVITVSPVFTAAVAVGDNYGAMTARYPRDTLVGKLNQFLAEQGDIPTEDTSLTTAADQTEYSLPALGVKQDLRQVFVATATAAPYYWSRLASWNQIYADAGVAGKIVFPYQLPSGYKLKLIYMAPHPAVYLDADKISEYVGKDWAGLETAVRAATWRLDQPGEDRDSLISKINDLLQQAARAQHRRRPLTPSPTPRLPYFPGS